MSGCEVLAPGASADTGCPCRQTRWRLGGECDLSIASRCAQLQRASRGRLLLLLLLPLPGANLVLLPARHQETRSANVQPADWTRRELQMGTRKTGRGQLGSYAIQYANRTVMIQYTIHSGVVRQTEAMELMQEVR